MPDEIPTIQVWPATYNVQKFVRHPLMPQIAFPDDQTQPVSWPNDTFTATLLRDGELLLAAADPGAFSANLSTRPAAMPVPPPPDPPKKSKKSE